MKYFKKLILAIAAYTALIAIGEWAGIGTKDLWDKFMAWAKKR